ncbi:MAG: HAD hydrolase-like protein [Treponema sp.]|jgi:phosphoglycolate phosphatase|nr:HAD hydrolase-like protein [Treponema sp.]
MNYTNILFDLDGTLTDPFLGITNSWKYALEKLNIEIDQNILKTFIGPPLEKIFFEYFKFDKENTEIGKRYYREYFSEKGLYENTLYDGVEDLLKELNTRNKICVLATSKPIVFAEKIIKHFNIDTYFKYTVGGNLEGTFVEKEDIIKHIVRKYNLRKSETILVGDRKYDIIGANKNGIKSIGVLYGYGSKEELENENPEYIINNAKEILEII